MFEWKLGLDDRQYRISIWRLQGVSSGLRDMVVAVAVGDTQRSLASGHDWQSDARRVKWLVIYSGRVGRDG